MIVYIRCSKCHHKEKAEGKSFGFPQCPKCQSNTVDMKIGKAPDWWANSDEVGRIEDKS